MDFRNQRFRSNQTFISVATSQVRNYLATQPEGVFTDLGCADGLLLAEIAGDFPNWTCIGLDISRQNIHLAMSRLAAAGTTNASAQTCDLRNDKVPSSNVFCANSLFHLLEYPFAAINSVVSALRPGGYLILTLPDERLYNRILVFGRKVLIRLKLLQLLNRIPFGNNWMADRALYLCVIPSVTASTVVNHLTSQGLTILTTHSLPRTHLLQPGHTLIAAKGLD